MPVITSDGVFVKPIRLTIKDFLEMTLEERAEYCKKLAEQFAVSERKPRGAAATKKPEQTEKDILDEDGF